jgi:hypothetical protein
VCENAGQIIISKLVSEPVLRMFDPKLPCELHTDASALGIGAALLQKEHGVVRPIAYYRRRTTDCEAKYCSYDLETLAIVKAVEHFRAYFYGMHFTIFTDCNAIRGTALKKDLHPRVARWWVKLQVYDFTIEYRPGSKMAHVDDLSRNPLDKVCIVRVTKPELTAIDSLRDYQKSDRFCQEVLNNSNDYNECQIKNDLVMTKGQDPKCFVPVAARLQAMCLYHDKSSHIGWEKCIATMREELFWPRMGQSLKKYIRNCRQCVLGKSHTGRLAGLRQRGERPSSALDVWHIDHAGPLVKSHGCTQLLVVIDAFSKYCSLRPIRKKSTEDTIRALSLVFE